MAAIWQQIVPIVPFLPVVPARKYCSVYNLHFPAHHGMEEVVGSIPTRSTNQINSLHILRMERRSSRQPPVGRRLGEQDAEGATCHSSQLAVRTAGENDWNLSSYRNPGR